MTSSHREQAMEAYIATLRCPNSECSGPSLDPTRRGRIYGMSYGGGRNSTIETNYYGKCATCEGGGTALDAFNVSVAKEAMTSG